MLQQQCLDKLVAMTAGITKTSQESLEWVQDCWFTIKHLPKCYKNYSYDLLGQKSTLLNTPISVTLRTFSPYLFIDIFEVDEDVYMNLTKEDLQTILKDEQLKNHLENGIINIRFDYSIFNKELHSLMDLADRRIFKAHKERRTLNAPKEILPLQIFLPYCKSTQSFNFIVIHGFRQCLHIRVHEFSEFLTVETNKTDSNYQYVTELNVIRSNYKYFLGVDFKDLEELINLYKDIEEKKDLCTNIPLFINESNRIIDLCKPSWPKIIYRVYGGDFIIECLCKIIFIDNCMLTYFQNNIFYQDEVFKQVTKPRLENRIKNVNYTDLLFCYNNNLLAREVIVKCNLFSSSRCYEFNPDILNIIKHFKESPEKQIQLEISVSSSSILRLQNILTKNTFLYDVITRLGFGNLFSSKEVFITAISILAKVSNLQVLLFDINSHYSIIDSIMNIEIDAPPQDMKIEKLVIDYATSRNINSFISFYPQIYQRIDKMYILIRDDLELINNDSIRNLQLLKSLHLSILIIGQPIKDSFITSMVNLGQILHKQTDLTYYFDEPETLRVQSILRINGWITVEPFNLPRVAFDESRYFGSPYQPRSFNLAMN